ncbi:hypothetical protein GQ457_15G028200 [Hibiscus cannabinus]
MIETNKDGVVEMVVLDGCFVVELFCIVGGLAYTNFGDPIFSMERILTFLTRDPLKIVSNKAETIKDFVLARSLVTSVITIITINTTGSKRIHPPL